MISAEKFEVESSNGNGCFGFRIVGERVGVDRCRT